MDLTGQRFGRLVVIDRGIGANPRATYWNCLCDCGNRSTVFAGSLRNAAIPTRSCGCLQREITKARNTTHGLHYTYQRRLWQGIKSRCYNPKTPPYKHYGERGIVMADVWLNDLPRFAADIGQRPTPRHSLDRIDNDGPYAPGNVRWATRQQQNRNYRRNHPVTFRGKTLTMTEWGEVMGLKQATIRYRLKCGWSPERALTTPLLRQRRHG